MTHPMTDQLAARVEEIAGKLTEAQWQAVLSAQETLFGDERVLRWHNRWDTKVLTNLESKGLAELCGINRIRLTPLGLAVREHLKASSKAEIPNDQ